MQRCLRNGPVSRGSTPINVKLALIPQIRLRPRRQALTLAEIA
jgi:hypothetical protein